MHVISRHPLNEMLSLSLGIDAIFFSNFSNYRARFSMPGDAESMFYSIDIGPVHFVIVSTGRSRSLKQLM